MFKKLIIGVILVVMFFGGGTVGAAEMQDVKKTSKSAVSSKKCWKRISWVERTTSMGDGKRAPVYVRSGSPVCLALEEVLNKTCEPPDELKCNWTLPPGEKRFKKLTWEPLDWKDYWGLVGDIRVSGIREDGREGLWKQDEPRIRKLFEEGKRSLSVAQVDIDNGGKIEQVVRYDLVPCHETPGSIFGVMDPKTRRLDWRFASDFSGVNFCEGAEIMLYNGKAYMFGVQSVWKTLNVYEGILNIGKIKYIRGEKP